MARWTQTNSDCEHISRIGSQLPIKAILKIKLQTGRTGEAFDTSSELFDTLNKIF